MGKFALDFDGIDILSKKLEKMNISVKEAAEEALKATHAYITPNVEAAADNSKYNFKHTGKTKGSLVHDDTVEWDGEVASIKIGFDISHGGLPSIFLMYGTPTISPDMELYNSIFGTRTKRKVEELQQEIFLKKLTEGGGK